MRVITFFAVCGLVACAGGGLPPLALDARRGAVPPTGLCRVWTGNARAHPVRSCDGIESTAPVGAEILYRPEDGSRRVVVCILSQASRYEIVGIDLYDVDTGRLVAVLQDFGDPPTGPSCREAYHAWP